MKMTRARENYERWCELVEDFGPMPSRDEIQFLLQECPDLESPEARWLRARPANDDL